MTELILPPLKPIPIKDRVSVLFVEKGNLDILDGAFVVVDKNEIRTYVLDVFPTHVEMNRPPGHFFIELTRDLACFQDGRSNLLWVGGNKMKCSIRLGQKLLFTNSLEGDNMRLFGASYGFGSLLAVFRLYVED